MTKSVHKREHFFLVMERINLFERYEKLNGKIIESENQAVVSCENIQ